MNSIVKHLMDFFSIKERPVSPAEFKKFWLSCNESDKLSLIYLTFG